MKQPWWVLLFVAVLAVGAGIGIGALFADDSSNADTVVITDSASAAPTTTSAPSTTSTPTSTDVTTTTTTTTTVAPTTVATTTAPAPPPTTAPEQPPVEDLVIVVVNGAGISGVAGATADLLRSVGYPNVEIADGDEIVAETAIYAADGLEPSAARIVTDLETLDETFVPPVVVAPLAESPGIAPAFPSANIILYLGQDQG